jgi:hypothetical protein
MAPPSSPRNLEPCPPAAAFSRLSRCLLFGRAPCVHGQYREIEMGINRSHGRFAPPGRKRFRAHGRGAPFQTFAKSREEPGHRGIHTSASLRFLRKLPCGRYGRQEYPEIQGIDPENRSSCGLGKKSSINREIFPMRYGHIRPENRPRAPWWVVTMLTVFGRTSIVVISTCREGHVRDGRQGRSKRLPFRNGEVGE